MCLEYTYRTIFLIFVHTAIIFFLMCCSLHSGIAQSSVIRENHPIAIKIGFEGLGLDVCLGRYIGIEATTVVFYYTTAKVRFFLLRNNISPFMGVGAGLFYGGFADREDNQWVSLHAGYEYSYKNFLFQSFVQLPVQTDNSDVKVPFYFNMNVGMRFM